ncbi:hypothetical protein ACH5RR_008848 [Cinchona calisaya]|uniref:Uncharacterized protein n=1 Tax=Cinchona calisaya TaxID=153742 RepID=A0ABD3AEZ9_9GENT
MIDDGATEVTDKRKKAVINGKQEPYDRDSTNDIAGHKDDVAVNDAVDNVAIVDVATMNDDEEKDVDDVATLGDNIIDDDGVGLASDIVPHGLVPFGPARQNILARLLQICLQWMTSIRLLWIAICWNYRTLGALVHGPEFDIGFRWSRLIIMLVFKPITMVEAKSVVHQMDKESALGPNGSLGFFFVACNDIVADDVLVVV